MPNFDTIWPVASFVLGAALTQINSILAERRQKAREVDARQHETNKTFLEGKRNFEAQVLSDLYQSLTALNDAADSLMYWYRGAESERDIQHAKDLCTVLRTETAKAWRLRGLLFESDLRENVGDAIGIELFPDGPGVTTSHASLSSYTSAIFDAHWDVAEKLRTLYAEVPRA